MPIAGPGCAEGPRSVGVLGFDLGAVAGPLGVEGAVLVDALVGVRSEEVTLSLHEGGREAVAADAVVVRQRRGERRCGDAGLGGGDDDATPGGLTARERFGDCLLYTSPSPRDS